MNSTLRSERESDIENAAVDYLRSCGIISHKMQKTAGWPDRMFIIPGGVPLFIEIKRPGEEPEPLQAYIHGILKKLGYSIIVRDSVFGIVEAVVEAMGSTPWAEAGYAILSGAKRWDPGG